MRLSRFALVLPAVALILGGCELRGGRGGSVVDDERNAEQGRLADENARLANENLKLKSQLDQARGTLADRKGGTIGDLESAATDIGGLTATGDGAIALSDDFSFAKGSADLNSEGRRSIEKLAAKLNQGDLANATIAIEGHTDSTPVSRPATKAKYGDNLGLSKARAEAVAEALIKAGVAAERLKTSGHGDSKPRSTGKSKEDQAKNRRVELRVLR